MRATRRNFAVRSSVRHTSAQSADVWASTPCCNIWRRRVGQPPVSDYPALKEITLITTWIRLYSRKGLCVSLLIGVIASAVGTVRGASREAGARLEVETALDGWSSRTSVLEGLAKISANVVPVLVSIAVDPHESHLRRWRAILLLGTFKTHEAVDGLARLSKDNNPLYRCFSIQSMAEIGSSATIPALIDKISDHDVCMKTVSSDPAEETQVFVSDEAVRALEKVTERSFGEGADGHKLTKPWQDWWEKHKQGKR